MDKIVYMQRAIDLARTRMREGRGHWPFGCVIVKDGNIVGEGCNDMGFSLDPTGHGEIVAIRDACKRLGTMDLSGCELYTSCEPCSLCSSAIWLTNIARVYYGAALDDCLQYGSDFTPLRNDVGKPIHERTIPAERVLGEEGRALLGEWAALIETTGCHAEGTQPPRSHRRTVPVRIAGSAPRLGSGRAAMSLHALRNLTDVALFVANLERAIAFYGETLGFELKRRDVGFAEFQTNGVGLALWEVSDVTTALGLAETSRQGLPTMVAVRVEAPASVDALYNELAAKGVTVVQAPTTHAWNARTTYFSDPDGNLWEIYAWVDAPRTL